MLITAVAFGPFRRQEKWAWYAFWVVPVMLLIQFLNSSGVLGWQFDLGLFFVTIAGLLWPFRLFFPKKVGLEGAESVPAQRNG